MFSKVTFQARVKVDLSAFFNIRSYWWVKLQHIVLEGGILHSVTLGALKSLFHFILEQKSWIAGLYLLLSLRNGI
jgi:hypothetical protein